MSATTPCICPMLRLFVLALAILTSAGAMAQGTCTNGFASLGGTSYSCDGVDVAAVLPTGVNGPFRTGALNDIWGWTDPLDGKEYALVGTRSGTVFVDVTVPNAPRVLGKLQTAVSQGFSTWRDIKTYGNVAVVVAEVTDHGMQVFDLTRLRGLSADPQRDFVEDALYTGFGRAHNVVVDPESGFAFGVGADGSDTTTCGGGGLHIVDIRDPFNPTFAGCFDDDGYTHDAQCLVYNGPDADYTGKNICVASNEDTVTIVDVTDPANPVQISRGFYPGADYTHQGWFTEDQRYFLVDDELDTSLGGTRTFTFDLEDLDNPEFLFRYDAPLSVTDHNQYTRGTFSYQSNYEGGLRIVDLSRLTEGIFTEAGHFDTYPQGDNPSFNGQWSNYPYFESGTVVASDSDNGLFVLIPDQSFFIVAEEEAPETTGATYTLSAPEPNPTTDRTTLSLQVAEAQQVRAGVYDLAGRELVSLLARPVAPGETVTLEVYASDLAAGVYVVRVTGETFEASQQLSIVR
ncbi:MAG: choice-of-anchor B family protein [Bacteroidota bacterium]